MIPGRHFAALQVQGDRPYQEDHFGCINDLKETDARPSQLLIVLADGMGGYRGGALASSVAVDSFLETYQSLRAKKDSETIDHLEQSLEKSNLRIRAAVEENPQLSGMGCTLVGAAFLDDGLVWISVGDSPFMRLRDGELKQLNADHSMAPIIAMRVNAGEISAEEAARHPHRNALRSALIGEPIPHTDVRETPVKLKQGDKFVLASDGLNTLSHQEIAAIVKEDADAIDIARGLLRAVQEKQRKGQDNTTVIVVSPFRNGDRTPIKDWTL